MEGSDDPHAATGGIEGEGKLPPVARVEPDETFSAHKSLPGVHFHSHTYT